MPDIILSQGEADALMAMDKVRADETAWSLPDLGGGVSIPLKSVDGREQFLLDVRRGRIDLRKNTFQERARAVVVLVRLDLGGALHRNPDGAEVLSPHLHVYREGYGDKWAVPAPVGRFPAPQDAWRTLNDFMAYCNVTQPPVIQRGLFA